MRPVVVCAVLALALALSPDRAWQFASGAPVSAASCGPVPNDTIVLPSNFKPYMVWDAWGVLNYTCNSTSGNYSLLGVLANQVWADNGSYAGYGYSAVAAPGVYIPTVVLTDEENSTTLGTLQTSTANAVNVPSHHPDSGFDYRRTCINQTGLLEPVVYLVRSNTTGGAAPLGKCSGSGITQVEYQATVTLYTCK